MGYWGSEIFESDYALCTLAELIDPFVDLIEKNAVHPTASEWDEITIDELVISARILMALVKDRFPVERLPKSEILKDNRDTFAERWRKYADGDKFQNERLTKILEVWDEMIKVSMAHEKSRR